MRPKPRSRRSALAGLPRAGSRPVLVPSVGDIRLDSVVPPQLRIPLEPASDLPKTPHKQAYASHYAYLLRVEGGGQNGYKR